MNNTSGAQHSRTAMGLVSHHAPGNADRTWENVEDPIIRELGTRYVIVAYQPETDQAVILSSHPSYGDAKRKLAYLVKNA